MTRGTYSWEDQLYHDRNQDEPPTEVYLTKQNLRLHAPNLLTYQHNYHLHEIYETKWSEYPDYERYAIYSEAKKELKKD